MEPSDDPQEQKREELRAEIDRRLISLDARVRNGQAMDERGEAALVSTLRSLLDALEGLEEIQTENTERSKDERPDERSKDGSG